MKKNMCLSGRSEGRVGGGFTLVELLVVIGIIALLISILLPSLNAARKSATLLKCQSNLRSIGQAIAVYTSENKSTLPVGQIWSWEMYDVRYPGQWNSPPKMWQYPSAPLVVDTWYWEFIGAPRPPNPYYLSESLKTTLRYKQQAITVGKGEERAVTDDGTPNGAPVYNQVWYCPDVVGTERWKDYSGHYRYNTFYAPGQRTSTMRNSSQAVLLWDIAWPEWTAVNYPHYSGRRSKAGVNALMGDGHVEYFTQVNLRKNLKWLPERTGGRQGETKFLSQGWRNGVIPPEDR